MPKPRLDPAMLIYAVAGIMIVAALDTLGVVTLGVVSTEGWDRYGEALLAGLYYGLGGAGGLIVWAIFRRFRPWK